VTLGASAVIFLPILVRRRLGAMALTLGGAFYLGYVVLVLAVLARSGG
jgi:hypothetical protein